MWRIRNRKHRLEKVPPLAAAAIAVLLAALLCARAAPPPEGAVAALWQAAADLRAVGSFTGAADAYERIASLTPGDPAPLVEIGAIYLSQRRWLLAADAFNRALARRADLAPAWTGLAAAEWEQGNRTQAAAHWETALRREPGLPAARLGLAHAHLQQGETDAAVEHLRAAADVVAGSPASSRAEAGLLLAAVLAPDDPSGARAALAAIPDDVPPETLARRNYLVAALDRAEAAASPAAAAKTVGLALAQAELWPPACAALARAAAFDLADFETLAFWGYAEGALGRPALRHLNAAVYLNPDHPLPRHLRGLHYLRQNLAPLAVSELTVAAQLDPGNAQAHLDLGRAYVMWRDYAKAEAAYAAAAAAAPHDLRILLARARFYADAGWGVADRGLAAAQAAVELAPQDARARDLLGWMYYLAGDLPQARLHLLSALVLDPQQASTYFHLGELYARQGWPEMAAAAWARAVDLDTEGDIRPRALARLGY
jgi:Tfp pilus assembly protein PilF